MFKKIKSDDKSKCETFYLHSKGETINESDIDDVLKLIYAPVISNIQKFSGKCSGWINDSVIDHNINITRYNPLAGRSYIKLPEELTIQEKVWLII